MRHMLKFKTLAALLQALIIIALSPSLRASELLFSNELNSNYVSKALTVVEITGALRGSGVLVLLNDQPVIITNSHILQGRKEARVRLPKRVNGFYDFKDGYLYK